MKKVFTHVPDKVWEFMDQLVDKLLAIELNPDQIRLLKFTKANLEFRNRAPLIDTEISLHFGDLHYYFRYEPEILEITDEVIDRSDYGTDSYSYYNFYFEGNDISQMDGDFEYMSYHLINERQIEQDEVQIRSNMLEI